MKIHKNMEIIRQIWGLTLWYRSQLQLWNCENLNFKQLGKGWLAVGCGGVNFYQLGVVVVVWGEGMFEIKGDMLDAKVAQSAARAELHNSSHQQNTTAAQTNINPLALNQFQSHMTIEEYME